MTFTLTGFSTFRHDGCLPWAFESSVIYQNFAGIENSPTITVNNAAIAPSLGRDLSSCGTAVTCNQNVTLDLVPAGTMYEPRIQQIDIRVGRLFQFDRYRIRGISTPRTCSMPMACSTCNGHTVPVI